MLSRACAGLAGGTIVISLPGSEHAVRLAMTQLILPELGHSSSRGEAMTDSGGATMHPMMHPPERPDRLRPSCSGGRNDAFGRASTVDQRRAISHG